MSQSTKQPNPAYRLWLRLGRLLTLTGVISLLALLSLASLGACAATPQPPVEVSLPDTPSPTSTSPPSTPPPASTPSPLITATPVISFNMNDLSGGSPVRKVNGFTTTIYLNVTNQALITGPETIMYVYDGDPQAGGRLIAQEQFPQVPPKTNGQVGIVSKEIIWDVRGKAGEHRIFSYLCLADVQPSLAPCYAWGGEVPIPRLVWDIEILNGKTEREFGHIKVKNRFERGETVKFRAFATNLTASETFVFTMTTTFYKDTPLQKPFAEENVTLPPGQMFEQLYEYETTAMLGTGAGIFLDLDGLQSQFPTLIDRRAWEKSTSFTFPLDAYFIAEPLTGTVPLTVSFRDSSFGSLDGYPMDTWLWSFGDGLTSTERFPIHTYTVPGNYTVALTSTAIGNNLWEVRELLRTKGISGHLATQTFIYTHTRPSYIEVLPADDGG